MLNKLEVCPTCMSTGKVVLDDGSDGDGCYLEVDCLDCEGTGYVSTKTARKIMHRKEMKVRKAVKEAETST